MEKLRQYIERPDSTIPGGESLNQFRSRVSPVLDEAFNYALKEGVPGLVVSHSSIIHEVGNLLLGNHEALLVHPGGVVVLGVEDGKTVGKTLLKPMADKKNAEVIS
jgi:broad specificity phosphatase PhoE